jgi:hypothetical protein
MRGVGDIIFSEWFFVYLFAESISEAAMGRTGVWGHNTYDKYDNKRATVLHFRGLFQKGAA